MDISGVDRLFSYTSYHHRHEDFSFWAWAPFPQWADNTLFMRRSQCLFSLCSTSSHDWGTWIIHLGPLEHVTFVFLLLSYVWLAGPSWSRVSVGQNHFRWSMGYYTLPAVILNSVLSLVLLHVPSALYALDLAFAFTSWQRLFRISHSCSRFPLHEFPFSLAVTRPPCSIFCWRTCLNVYRNFHWRVTSLLSLLAPTELFIFV